MNNYIVLESEKTKERVIMKPITDKLLMLYRVKRHVVNGEMINYKQLGKIIEQEKLKYIVNYKSFTEIPSEIDFEYDYQEDIL